MRPTRTISAFIIILALLAGCSGPQWGEYVTPTPEVSPTALPPTATLIPTPVPPTVTPTPLPPTETIEPSPSPIPTSAGTPKPPILYYTQSGDWLAVVATRFGVATTEITSPDTLPTQGFLDPNTLLIIPDVLNETTPSTHIMPDSEVVYSATALDFNTSEYVAKSGGYLNEYMEYLKSTSNTSGAQIVERIAIENSLNPRLLLALLEYESGWVRGQPVNLSKTDYPMGYYDFNADGLFAQMTRAIEDLSQGYYDWRGGTLTNITFPDGRTIRLSPELNAGSAALQFYFSKHYNYDDWAKAIDTNVGLPALYNQMFGDPWQRANGVEPIFPPGLTQPELTLPFLSNIPWAFTGGPHPAWELRGALAALDFAPSAEESGCVSSAQWVVAPAPGLVVRSGNGVVALDLDGDGKEQTGWVILFLHIESLGRITRGSYLDQDSYIGHPSCEGGIATGTHLHIARKYNGEWVLADSPVPFTLDGWVAHAGSKPYLGTLTKGDQTVTASMYGDYKTRILREKKP